MAVYKVEICGVNTSKLPLLTEEEKKELFVKIRKGDREAREKFIKGNKIETQAEQSCKNVGAILEEAGLTFDNVIKTTCFLADMADFAAFNAVYEKYFTSKPARSCVAVKQLPKNVLCEVEAIAVAE